MKMVATFFFLLPLAFCVCLQPHLTAARAFYIPETAMNNPNLVEEACGQAMDKSFCVNIISSDQSDGPKRNLKDIAFIAFRNAAKIATETSSYIQGVSDDDGLSGTAQQALSDCKESYISAADLIEDAIDELVANDYPDVVKFGKAALDGIDACNAGVKDQHQEAATRSLSVRQMLDTALSVTNVLIATPSAS